MSTPIENNTEELQAILQTVNNLPNAGGRDSSDVFVVHVTMDETWQNIASVDKAIEEIAEAANSGKACFAVLNKSTVIPMYAYSSEGGASFIDNDSDGRISIIIPIEGSPVYEYYRAEAYAIYVTGPDNGEVISDVISAVSEVDLFYRGLNGAGIRLNATIFNIETHSLTAGYSIPLNVGYCMSSSSGYYCARTFVKEGYFDISFYEENENEVRIIRWEASFTKTA